jgi:signal transduction histidine kinase
MGRPRTDSPNSRLLTISRSLQVIAVILLLLIFAVTAQQLMHWRSSEVAATEQQMARLDMVFAEQTGRAVESVDLILRGLTETVQPQISRPAGDRVAVGDLIRHRIEGVRQLNEIVFVNQRGQIAFSSATAESVAFVQAARLISGYHAAHPGGELAISAPVRGDNGVWTALMSRRISAADGAYDGAAIAFLNLQYFEDFYKAVQLTEGGAIVLHRRDGTVLARYPHSDSAIGASFADLPPFKDILAHDIAGTLVMDSPIDGSRRILAIRALRAFPLAVNVSVDEARVLLPWRRQTWLFAGTAVIVGAIIGGLLLLLARRSREIEQLVGEFRAARDLAERTSLRLTEQMEERERAETALRQAQRVEAVGQLTGGVAHDFNNLLTVVLGNLDLLQRRDGLDDTVLQRLGVIRAAAERGATLTAQLLAFARRQPLVPRAVDLNGVIKAMHSLLQSALRSPVQVVTELSPDLWPAMVDATQVELVVLNLAINARDAMPDGGRLTIRTANVHMGPPERHEDPPEGDHIMVAVGDNGEGMTQEVLAKAFEPFFTTKAPGAGSGLGLSQVVGLARQSGGGVRLESTPGKGTTVRVYLPRALTMEGVTAPPLAASAGPSGTARVLLVDDDIPVRETTAMILDSLGYVVIQADDGDAALRILQTGEEVDVLLTDVAMPVMSGRDLARQAKLMRPALPVVFITGFADPQTLNGDESLKRLVRKPFRPTLLAAQIEAALTEVDAPA